jgi:hypothetical protein
MKPRGDGSKCFLKKTNKHIDFSNRKLFYECKKNFIGNIFYYNRLEMIRKWGRRMEVKNGTSFFPFSVLFLYTIVVIARRACE